VTRGVYPGRCRGERHYSAKLTEFDVGVIRKLAAAKVPLFEIASHYPQVSKVAVHKVVKRKSWRHVA
jgi:hypothetical protein